MHPIDFVESLLATHTKITHVQISVYRYHPQSLWDDRTTHTISVGQLRSKYERLKEKLGDEEDIAFHSVVTTAGKKPGKRHLGLIDFVTADLQIIEKASELLRNEYRLPPTALVHSGRSYHLYLGVLLSHASWVRFMGRILLLNPRTGPPTVDSRWVGHRLLGGYSALRWSANHSPCTPEVVREWGLQKAQNQVAH